jgi:threonine/homoserine/homoserine lactone efflux protein
MKLINEILKLLGIAVLVYFGWHVLEVAIMGSVSPRKIDEVIAWILTFSLYGNLKWIEKHN